MSSAVLLFSAILLLLLWENSRTIFIAILCLYGTRRDTKIISTCAKKFSTDEGFVAEARREGQETKAWVDLSGHERIWERSDDRRMYKYWAKYPGVWERSLEGKYANLRSAWIHFDAIISMKIVEQFSLLCCACMAHAGILRYGRK